MKTISSQRHIDNNTVQAKRDAKDYEVKVSPEFDVCGERMRVIIDGHHSYAAAVADGVAPVYVTATKQDDNRIGILDSGDVDGYLVASWHDADYYDVQTGKDLF